MIIKSAEIVMSAMKKEQYPNDNKPIIALSGRSNVGKSSLINSVLKRKSLARVSGSPGKTRTINFYLINDEFYLVDLPGYGYAKMSKTDTQNWNKVMDDFFKFAKNLKCLFLLLDIRHEPKITDIKMYEYCKYYDIDMKIIATKSDKISRGKYNSAFKTIRNALELDNSVKIYPHSSLKKDDAKEILDLIENIVNE